MLKLVVRRRDLLVLLICVVCVAGYLEWRHWRSSVRKTVTTLAFYPPDVEVFDVLPPRGQHGTSYGLFVRTTRLTHDRSTESASGPAQSPPGFLEALDRTCNAQARLRSETQVLKFPTETQVLRIPSNAHELAFPNEKRQTPAKIQVVIISHISAADRIGTIWFRAQTDDKEGRWLQSSGIEVAAPEPVYTGAMGRTLNPTWVNHEINLGEADFETADKDTLMYTFFLRQLD